MRPESDAGKTGRASPVFKGSGRVALVLGLSILLFAGGVWVGRAGGSDPGGGKRDGPCLSGLPCRGPEPTIAIDAGSIRLLDASLELRPIEGFDADVPSGR